VLLGLVGMRVNVVPFFFGSLDLLVLFLFLFFFSFRSGFQVRSYVLRSVTATLSLSSRHVCPAFMPFFSSTSLHPSLSFSVFEYLVPDVAPISKLVGMLLYCTRGRSLL